MFRSILSLTVALLATTQAQLPPSITESFTNPAYNMVRLHYCAGYDARIQNNKGYLLCGKPNADGYCQSLGYTSATVSVQDEKVKEPLVYMLNGEIASAAGNTSAFKIITCYKPLIQVDF